MLREFHVNSPQADNSVLLFALCFVILICPGVRSTQDDKFCGFSLVIASGMCSVLLQSSDLIHALVAVDKSSLILNVIDCDYRGE